MTEDSAWFAWLTVTLLVGAVVAIMSLDFRANRPVPRWWWFAAAFLALWIAPVMVRAWFMVLAS